ncbi:MAG: MFS transporter [Thermoleophilia bacterium]
MPIALEGRRRWLIMPVLALGISLIIVDSTIVNVALPQIIDGLHLDLSQAEWTNSLYSLVFAALLIAVGSTADRYGRRKLFIIGAIVFALASVMAALATTAATLLGARALQGVGGAMILPTSLSLVNANFRGRDRATAFGIWGATIAGMAAVGPVLGGWLTTNFSWRLIFWINPPLALIVIIGALLVVPESKEPDAPGLRDWVGVLLISSGLALLIFGLIEGERYGWWHASEPFGLLGGEWPLPGSPVPWALGTAIALLTGFVAWTTWRERRGRTTLINLRLFRLPSFRWGGVTILIVSLGEFGVIFVIPLFLQNVLGMSALGAGLVILALAVGALTSGGAAAPVSRRLGGHRIVQLGMVLEIVGILLFALVVEPGVSPWMFVAPLFIYGLGVGFATAQLTNVALAEVPITESGQASAVQSTLRQVGSALGTAVLGVALAVATTTHVTSSLTGEGVPHDQAVSIADAVKSSAGTAIPELSHAPATAHLAPALDQSFADAVTTVGYVAAIFVFLGLLASFRIPARRGDPDAR